MLVNYPLLVFASTFAALLLTVKIGDVFRRRLHLMRQEGRDDFGVVLTGTLTLLGLIIGFNAVRKRELLKAYLEQRIFYSTARDQRRTGADPDL